MPPGVMPNERVEQLAATLAETSDFEPVAIPPVATQQQYKMHRQLRKEVRIMFQERKGYHTTIGYNPQTKTTADRTFGRTQQFGATSTVILKCLQVKKTSTLGLTVSRLQASP